MWTLCDSSTGIDDLPHPASWHPRSQPLRFQAQEEVNILSQEGCLVFALMRSIFMLCCISDVCLSWADFLELAPAGFHLAEKIRDMPFKICKASMRAASAALGSSWDLGLLLWADWAIRWWWWLFTQCTNFDDSRCSSHLKRWNGQSNAMKQLYDTCIVYIYYIYICGHPLNHEISWIQFDFGRFQEEKLHQLLADRPWKPSPLMAHPGVVWERHCRQKWQGATWYWETLGNQIGLTGLVLVCVGDSNVQTGFATDPRTDLARSTQGQFQQAWGNP